MTKYFNRSEQTLVRRTLRNNMSKSEVILWSRLKGKQMLGFKFRRQYGVGEYVVDFYCPSLKLAIEVDGDSHFEDGAQAYDTTRQTYIESFGIRVIRFTNDDVSKNLDGVLLAIQETIERLRQSFSPPC